uniref:Glyoxalase-like domain-containing protein n=2 Tax=Magnetospirillum gryphiswaldense TaxID=55518 RepID=A4TXM8_9PROT|nr:conserved hypothetical protein [Magnetospirillum gryphiswaldense MSR-1]
MAAGFPPAAFFFYAVAMTCQLDHLVVAARSLGEGIGHIAQRLGVAPTLGGKHARMGTHNALLSLGPDCYLEVISIDPEASAPEGPRWFGLDRFTGIPRLVNWVARTQSIDRLRQPDEPALDMQRGDFRWRFAAPFDGQPRLGGTVPALIQWQDGGHPCNRLPDHGVRLKRLTLSYADSGHLHGELARLGLAERVQLAGNGAALRAEILVAGKVVELS